MGLKTFIKSLFGKYETGHEYWIMLDKIIVPDKYKRSHIREEKWRKKLRYWHETGKFESEILLNKDFVLVDGYSSYKIAFLNGVDKVPVRFVV